MPSLDTPAHSVPPSLTTVPTPSPVGVLNAAMLMPIADAVEPIAATCRFPLLVTVPVNSSASTPIPSAKAVPGAFAVTFMTPSFSIVPVSVPPAVKSATNTPNADAEPERPAAAAETSNVPDDAFRMLTGPPAGPLTQRPAAKARSNAVVEAVAVACATTVKSPEFVTDSTPPPARTCMTPNPTPLPTASLTTEPNPPPLPLNL